MIKLRKSTVTALASLALAAAMPAVASAQDMTLRDLLIEGEGWQLVASGFKFTEGPIADAAGNVFFTDIPNSRIHRVDAATGQVTVWKENTFNTNGLAFDAKGRLLGCQGGKKRVVAFDDKGEPTEIAAGNFVPNDLVVTPEGGLYFTNPDGGQVYYVGPDGAVKVAAEGIVRPNGITLSPDRSTVLVADSRGFAVLQYQRNADGTLKNRLSYVGPLRSPVGRPANLGAGADGLKTDGIGRTYVATAAGVQVFDPTGREIGLLSRPVQRSVSNLCFGGPGLDILYITIGDSVYKRRVKATGVRFERPPGK
jgi:sugar lactone lactonase YvrE